MTSLSPRVYENRLLWFPTFPVGLHLLIFITWHNRRHRSKTATEVSLLCIISRYTDSETSALCCVQRHDVESVRYNSKTLWSTPQTSTSQDATSNVSTVHVDSRPTVLSATLYTLWRHNIKQGRLTIYDAVDTAKRVKITVCICCQHATANQSPAVYSWCALRQCTK